MAAVFALTGQSWAAGFAPVWQLGTDDGGTLPFQSENYNANPAPGSASVLDDDYYLEGTYAAPVGVVAVNEPLGNFERSITSGDPRKRVHFPLTATQVSNGSRLRVTIDLFGGGAWVGYSLPGFNSHDVAVRINGVLVATRPAITWDATMVVTVPATSVNAVAGANVVQVERVGGTGGGYIQFDYLKLEVDPTGLLDGDGDGIPKWFEETYGLTDGDSSDAVLDFDLDGLSNLQEAQRGTNPTAPDTDNDGLNDVAEITTNPLSSDSDGDGLLDGEEISSNPASPDSDSDGYPDNIEIEHGTNPMSGASKPFGFPGGAIGFQFIAESRATAALKPGELAGLFRFPNWNISPPQPKWNGTAYTGAATGLKNHRGEVSTVAINWSARSATEGFHRGSSDENLLSGRRCAAKIPTGKFSCGGLLMDRWKTPLVIHPQGWRQIEIRSAGVDKMPYTNDDLIILPTGMQPQ